MNIIDEGGHKCEACDGKLPALTDSFALVPAGLGSKAGDYGALALVTG